MVLEGKKIIVGVTGSIAAYKSAFLVRLLVKAGADVQVIMTLASEGFITPLTLSTLSGNPVLSTFIDNERGVWNNHVSSALWADVILIAPATSTTIGKLAHGISDNLLIAVCMSAKCPVLIAPAMDLDMWLHPSTQQNIAFLQTNGIRIIDPGYGELASGLIGEGRMEEPEKLLDILTKHFLFSGSLAGKKAMVTAGPTYESIDPVRFIGNHSTGKMGFAIAESLALRGADVTLVSGPTELTSHTKNIDVIKVKSSDEMLQSCLDNFTGSDITVMAAAVADYKPANLSKEKIKKNSKNLDISLTSTKDILAELGKQKHKEQILVGFALETENEIPNAIRKLESKNMDMIVLNSLQDKGAGFGYNTNKVTIIDRDKKITEFGLKPKSEVAEDIVSYIVNSLT